MCSATPRVCLQTLVHSDSFLHHPASSSISVFFFRIPGLYQEVVSWHLVTYICTHMSAMSYTFASFDFEYPAIFFLFSFLSPFLLFFCSYSFFIFTIPSFFLSSFFSPLHLSFFLAHSSSIFHAIPFPFFLTVHLSSSLSFFLSS